MPQNRVLALCFVAASSLANPAAAQDFLPYAVSATPSQDGRCPGDGGKADLDRSENACFAQLPAIASRQGSALRVKFRDGSSRVYKNKREGCEQADNADNCTEYQLTGYLAEHRFLLIQTGYYEGVDWKLVRLDDGKETTIVAPPHYSPGEKWLASACWSDGPSGCTNGIDIVPTASAKAAPEWHYRPHDDDYVLFEYVGWDGDNRLKLNVTFHPDPHSGDLKTQPASVELINDAWQLRMPPEYLGPARR